MYLQYLSVLVSPPAGRITQKPEIFTKIIKKVGLEIGNKEILERSGTHCGETLNYVYCSAPSRANR